MQREIGTQIDIAKNVSAFEGVGHVPSIDKTAPDFEKADTKVKKLKRLIDTAEYDANIARYISGTIELAYQRMLGDIKTIEQVVHSSYKDLETFDFQLLLDKNLYTNLNSVHFVFPIKFKKKSDINADISADLTTVNNFFARWIQNYKITKYDTNKELTPTMTPQGIYQYSEAMLKHLPAKSLKVIENDPLYSKEEVVIPYNLDRRFHGMVKDANNRVIHNVIRSNGNFRDREAKFRNQLKDKYVYRIPLKYFYDIGKINFPTKIHMKIRLTLETDMKKLFQSDTNHMGNPKPGKTADSTNPNDYETDETPQTSDVQIVLLKAPMIQYKQLTLDTNFRQYLETILFSAKVLRMGVQKTPYQKTYELQAGSQDFMVDFQGANGQFDWIEISLIYDKSDKHLTAYDSYNAECASKFINYIEFANISDQHSSTNTLKFDIGNDLQKHLLRKQYLARCTNGCSTAPVTDFMDNPIAQELKKENEYFSDKFDERLYVDLRQSHGYT